MQPHFVRIAKSNSVLQMKIDNSQPGVVHLRKLSTGEKQWGVRSDESFAFHFIYQVIYKYPSDFFLFTSLRMSSMLQMRV